jgi:hypothetical protein
MESKLSGDKIKSYSIDFAERVCDQFFHSKLKITGKEILSLTAEKQVNLFVLKNLFKLWEKESEKLKSNYFDYEATPVKAALENFLNTLSQNIYIARAHFEPLLVQSVYDALLLILSPYDYYRMELSTYKLLKLEELKKISKYVQINKHLIIDLMAKMESKDIPELDNRNVLFLFDQVCEQSNATPDDVEDHLRLLGQVKQLRAEDFYIEEEKKAHPPSPHIPQRESESAEQKRILAERFGVNAPTLNEKFGSDSSTTLAEKLQRGKIQSIKSSLPINQKFIYINNLFNGNIQEFAEAADKIDECTSLNEVKDLIRNNFIPKYKWNQEDEVYKEFVEVVERKYM